MRPICVVTILGIGLCAASCKKTTPREAPDGGRAQSGQPSAVNSPTTFTPAQTSIGAHLSEHDLFRFIAVSRRTTAALHAANRPIDASPDGFLNLDAAVPGDAVIDPVLNDSNITPAEWSKLGARAWAAWSVAQVDYNAESALRDNARQLAAANRRLATAEASLRNGSRVLNDSEREVRVASLEDAAGDANDRAEMWASTATSLRDRIDAVIAMAESLSASAAADQGNTDPAQTTALNNSLSDLAATHTQLSQDLASAERNERDAREQAAHAGQAALHPEEPMSEEELADLRRESNTIIQRSKLEIARLEAENEKLQTRLEDDHRAEASSRAKAGSEADISLMRDHLEEFNAAWGLGVDGRPVAPRRATTSSR